MNPPCEICGEQSVFYESLIIFLFTVLDHLVTNLRNYLTDYRGELSTLEITT